MTFFDELPQQLLIRMGSHDYPDQASGRLRSSSLLGSDTPDIRLLFRLVRIGGPHSLHIICFNSTVLELELGKDVSLMELRKWCHERSPCFLPRLSKHKGAYAHFVGVP